MTTKLQADANIPFHREFEAAWNELRKDKPWIPEMRMEPDARERMEAMLVEFKKLAEMEGNEPIRCSRIHFADWAETLQMALDEAQHARLNDDA